MCEMYGWKTLCRQAVWLQEFSPVEQGQTVEWHVAWRPAGGSADPSTALYCWSMCTGHPPPERDREREDEWNRTKINNREGDDKIIFSCNALLFYSLTSFRSFSKSSSSAPMMLMAGLEHWAPNTPRYGEREGEKTRQLGNIMCYTLNL